MSTDETAAIDWLIEFCKTRGLEWAALSKREQFNLVREIPCSIRCWRVGVSIDVAVGENCPECGHRQEPPPLSRLDLITSDDD